jgi:hypothetical protein
VLRPALGPDQLPVPWVTGIISSGVELQVREACHWPLFSAEIKNLFIPRHKPSPIFLLAVQHNFDRFRYLSQLLALSVSRLRMGGAMFLLHICLRDLDKNNFIFLSYCLKISNNMHHTFDDFLKIYYKITIFFQNRWTYSACCWKFLDNNLVINCTV